MNRKDENKKFYISTVAAHPYETKVLGHKFETMVFKKKPNGEVEWSGIEQERTDSEEEANLSHDEFVAQYL